MKLRGSATRRFRKDVMRAVALAFVLVAMLALTTPRAHAGIYVASNCSTYVPGAPDAVSSTNTTVFPRTADCSNLNTTGTGMRIKNSGGVGSGYGYGAWSWYAPAGTLFSELAFQFHVDSDSGHSASITASNAGGALGVWNTPQNGWQGVGTVPIFATSVTAWLECGSNCAPSPTNAHTYVRNLYFTISDSTHPQFASLGGQLFSDGVRRGTEEITVSGFDNANLTGISVRANGVLIDERQTSCDVVFGGPAKSFHPCPIAAAWTIPVNTELLPDGENTIEVCLFDLAFDPGAKNATCETRAVQVDNSCPSSGGVQATSLDARLQAGNGPLRTSIRVSSNKGATARGTLDAPGNVAGSTVCLYEQVDLPGDGRELVDTARVRNDGSFALDVDPGPSRLFDVVYRYNSQMVERQRLYLDSVVAPAFNVVGRRSLVNGQNVRFRGHIPGPNAEGRGISLQAQAGRKWRTFKQVKANSTGKFRGLYRFTQTRGLARYTFRARVKKQGNYPYSPGSSKRRKITVRG
jgi:hypothetical protein